MQTSSFLKDCPTGFQRAGETLSQDYLEGNTPYRAI